MAIENKDSNQGDKQGVGALLRASRLRIGEDLRDVSLNLRIRRVYLEAIEATQYEDLPGAAYAVGFVRAYSEYLGLDSAEVVRRFKDEYAGLGNRPDLVFPVPVTERSVPGGAILLLSAVAALVAYGGWYFVTNSGDPTAEKVPSLPERLASLLPSKGEKAVEKAETEQEKTAEESQEEESEQAATEVLPSQEAETEPESEQAKSTEPVVEQEVTDEKVETPVTVESAPVVKKPSQEAETSTQLQDTPPAEVAKKPEPVVEVVEKAPEPEEKPEVVVEEPKPLPEPEKVEKVVEKTPIEEEKQPVAKKEEKQEAAIEPPAKPKEEPLSTDGSRILVKAKTASWIQVRDDEENKMLLTRLLRPGDSYRVPNKEGLVLLTSNAGALDIFVDGKPVPSIGDFGAVRRSVVLDPKKLLDGSAVGE